MGGLQKFIKTAGMNSGAMMYVKMMRVSEVEEDAELSGIFTIDGRVLGQITESMKAVGYDHSEPLVIWRGSRVVVDGHTRLRAARDAGISEVPVVELEFQTMDEAKAYAYKRQAERRNLTQAEIFAAATSLKLKVDDYNGGGRSRDKLAEDLGVSSSTIQHARSVAASAPAEDIEAIKKGELSINKAYNKIREKKKARDSHAPEIDTSCKDTAEEPGEEAAEAAVEDVLEDDAVPAPVAYPAEDTSETDISALPEDAGEPEAAAVSEPELPEEDADEASGEPVLPEAAFEPSGVTKPFLPEAAADSFAGKSALEDLLAVLERITDIIGRDRVRAQAALERYGELSTALNILLDIKDYLQKEAA